MNKYSIWLLVGAVALLCACGFVLANKPQTGGDFAGGNAPSQLWTANSNTASVSPISGAPNIVTAGTVIANDIIQGDAGFSLTVSTSTTILPSQFCATTVVHVIGTPAAATLTLPAATSTYIACGSPAPGSWSTQIIVNDSTNTVTEASSTGVTLLNETVGPGTSTIQGVVNTIPANSTQVITGIWLSSSSIYVMSGNTFH